MSRSLNKVMLIGHVGNAPEMRTTSAGTQIAKLSVATNRKWTDGSGNEQEAVQWHRCTAFGKLAEIIEKWVKKGDRIYVEGRVEYSESEGEGGQKKYWTDIVMSEMVMLGGNGGGNGNGGNSGGDDEKLPF